VQEGVCWEEEPVIFSRLKCENLLAHGTRIQAIFPPQSIQELEVGEMEKKFGSMIDRGNALERES
jgi:hypothetical protein